MKKKAYEIEYAADVRCGGSIEITADDDDQAILKAMQLWSTSKVPRLEPSWKAGLFNPRIMIILRYDWMDHPKKYKSLAEQLRATKVVAKGIPLQTPTVAAGMTENESNMLGVLEWISARPDAHPEKGLYDIANELDMIVSRARVAVAKIRRSGRVKTPDPANLLASWYTGPGP